MAANSGLGVDASGAPVIDPTENVKALVEAEIRHLSEMASLRAEHAKDIREIETKRLDAIRQVDVMNASSTADRALVAIQTLATQTATNAETLRALVATT